MAAPFMIPPVEAILESAQTDWTPDIAKEVTRMNGVLDDVDNGVKLGIQNVLRIAGDQAPSDGYVRHAAWLLFLDDHDLFDAYAGGNSPFLVSQEAGTTHSSPELGTRTGFLVKMKSPKHEHGTITATSYHWHNQSSKLIVSYQLDPVYPTRPYRRNTAPEQATQPPSPELQEHANRIKQFFSRMFG